MSRNCVLFVLEKVGWEDGKLSQELLEKEVVDQNGLEDLSKKLLAIFEENWETTQSIKELNVLKHQNENILRVKIKELERAIGNADLYNKTQEEISALKDVMINKTSTFFLHAGLPRSPSLHLTYIVYPRTRKSQITKGRTRFVTNFIK